jgi:hypothetical protein
MRIQDIFACGTFATLALLNLTGTVKAGTTFL